MSSNLSGNVPQLTHVHVCCLHVHVIDREFFCILNQFMITLYLLLPFQENVLVHSVVLLLLQAQ